MPLWVKIYRRFRLTLLSSRVSYLRLRGRYSKAMETLDKIYAMRLADKPSPIFSPYINLLCAAIALELNDRFMAFEACKVSLEQLLSPGTHTKSKFSQQDIDYMIYYCKLALVSSTKHLESPAWALAKSIDIEYGALNMEAVKPLLRKDFLVREALGAEFEAFASKKPPARSKAPAKRSRTA